MFTRSRSLLVGGIQKSYRVEVPICLKPAHKAPSMASVMWTDPPVGELLARPTSAHSLSTYLLVSCTRIARIKQGHRRRMMPKDRNAVIGTSFQLPCGRRPRAHDTRCPRERESTCFVSSGIIDHYQPLTHRQLRDNSAQLVLASVDENHRI